MVTEFDKKELSDYYDLEYKPRVIELLISYGFKGEFPQCLESSVPLDKDKIADLDTGSSDPSNIEEGENYYDIVLELANTIKFIRLSKNYANCYLKITSNIIGSSKISTKSTIENIEKYLMKMLYEYKYLIDEELIMNNIHIPLDGYSLSPHVDDIFIPYNDDEIDKIIKMCVNQFKYEEKFRSKIISIGFYAQYTIKNLYDNGVFQNINGEGENISNELAFIYDLLVLRNIIVDTNDKNKNEKYKYIKYCIQSYRRIIQEGFVDGSFSTILE